MEGSVQGIVKYKCLLSKNLALTGKIGYYLKYISLQRAKVSLSIKSDNIKDEKGG